MKLTKDEATLHTQYTAGITDKYNALVAGIDAFNAAVRAAFEAHLADPAQAWTEEIEGAVEHARSVGDRLQDAFDAKSERWQESEAGEQARALAEAWQDFTPDIPDLAAPDDLAYPDAVVLEEWAALPMTAEDA